MANYSIFDILGPIMIGPSSSHTAGAARLGKAARDICGKPFKAVTFVLHGSFAKTYRGHGTDKALVAGVLGMQPYDEKLKLSLETAEQMGIHIAFDEAEFPDCHENTAKIIFTLFDDTEFYVMGSSVGGGSILITDINGFETELTGEYPTIIINHIDKKGVISNVSSVLAKNDINIGVMKVKRKQKGQKASMIIETDDYIHQEIVDELIKIENVISAKVLNPISAGEEDV